MVARCSRCHKMYAEEGSGSCYYHPGTHRGDGNHGRTGLMCGWACCKARLRLHLRPDPTPQPLATAPSPQLKSHACAALQELAEDAKGCRLVAQHIPCEATAAAMSRFPKVAQAQDEASDGMRRRSCEAREPPPAAPEGEPPRRKQARYGLGASAAQAVNRPRLAEARGSLRHALALTEAGWPKAEPPRFRCRRTHRAGHTRC